MWVVLSSLAVAALFVAAAYCSVLAARTARTPQGAVGWVVFLLSAPQFALPLYLFLGQHRFRGYLIARRKTEQVVEGIKDYKQSHGGIQSPSHIPLGPFEYCASMPAVRGNSARILIDGAATFDAMFAAIDAAQTYVIVQFYIIHDDAQGKALQDRLIAAANRGVSVRLLVDAVGSIRLTQSYSDTLRGAGVEVVDTERSPKPKHRFQLNFRNHRKTLIVDGTVGFTGGLNAGDEYMGRSPVFGAWRDTHVEIRGPMVTQLQLIFAEDWHWATGALILEELTWEAPHAPEDMIGLIAATGPADETETGSLMFFAAISAAQRRLWIASPYFVPDIDITAALRAAALRGVDVRLLVPDVIDHYLPWLAAFSYFDDIREAGVRVFRYHEGFMHQKVFVVDDDLAAVGTHNLDNRSFRLNFEAMALFFDHRAADDVAHMLSADFERATELKHSLAEQPARIRYGAPIARLFSPLL